uniref:Uncharacterized protein n=1 Tax=Arundo donax TaxID=35708 RepID=A0A0A9C7Z5_ARUDO
MHGVNWNNPYLLTGNAKKLRWQQLYSSTVLLLVLNNM